MKLNEKSIYSEDGTYRAAAYVLLTEGRLLSSRCTKLPLKSDVDELLGDEVIKWSSFMALLFLWVVKTQCGYHTTIFRNKDDEMLVDALVAHVDGWNVNVIRDVDEG